MFQLVISVAALVVFCSANIPDYTIVQLPPGKIRGHILKSAIANKYYAFQEIPYAAPPVGKNRFQLPKNPEPWSGILNTTRNTAVCYQSTLRVAGLNMTEDCLYLNVYTTVPPGTTQSLPVLVWIHGGGFVAGSGIFQYYNPKFFMEYDVVIVTINYRLGVFGFLTTNDDVMPANLGMKDQYKALEWVHENIGLFGGNKSHVTIFGESAGSRAVGMHLLGPWQDNKVLFQAAIMQSGSMTYLTRSNTAREAAFRISHSVNSTFTPKNSNEVLEVLQRASTESIFGANTTGGDYPIVEKHGPFSYQMYDCLTNGNIKKVPVIIGFNSEECLYTSLYPNVKTLAQAFDKDPSQLINSQFNLTSTNRSIAGNLIKKIYTNTTFVDNLGAYVRFISDNTYTTPLLKQAELQSKYTDVYLYQFSYKGELGRQMGLPVVPGAERVGHAEDLWYMWGDENSPNISNVSIADRGMLQRFVQLWINFAKHHNPTPVQDSLFHYIKWPRVDSNRTDSIQYMNLNTSLTLRTNPRYFQAVKNVLDYYVTPEDII